MTHTTAIPTTVPETGLWASTVSWVDGKEGGAEYVISLVIGWERDQQVGRWVPLLVDLSDGDRHMDPSTLAPVAHTPGPIHVVTEAGDYHRDFRLHRNVELARQYAQRHVHALRNRPEKPEESV